jgi:SAM-dependent methyltransferase
MKRSGTRGGGANRPAERHSPSTGPRITLSHMVIRQVLQNAMRRSTVPIRRHYYDGAGGRRLVGRLPVRARYALGLDDASAIGSRKVEIGPGLYPRQGYIHIDVFPYGRHSEAVAPMWELPLPTGWAEEILAVHSLEHAPPPRLLPTLIEWRRVLRPGGQVSISVPNGPAIMDAYCRAPITQKWPLMGSLLGMYCSPSITSAAELTMPSDHQIVFDWDLLRWALDSAGFEDVTDVTGRTADRHTEAWGGMVRHYSLAASARSPRP